MDLFQFTVEEMESTLSCVLVMGVSGCGKSSVASALQSKLGDSVLFLDADGFHPPENIAKMKNGVPLTDEDRWGWLSAIRHHILSLHAADGPVRCVLACSALKRRYRKFLQDGGSSEGSKIMFKVVFLDGSFTLLESRINSRVGHFMPASLLQSQFDALEPPTAESGEDVLRIWLDDLESIDTVAQKALSWVLGS